MSVSTEPARHWFITGASGALGRHLTDQALRAGGRVAATVRHPAALGNLRASHGDRLSVETLDLARPAAVTAVLDRTLRGDPVDVVVNNAGYAVVGAAEE